MMGAVRAKHWTKRLIQATCIWLASVDFCRTLLMSIPPCAFQGWPSACLTRTVFGHAPAQEILLASTDLGIGKHQV